MEHIRNAVKLGKVSFNGISLPKQEAYMKLVCQRLTLRL